MEEHKNHFTKTYLKKYRDKETGSEADRMEVLLLGLCHLHETLGKQINDLACEMGRITAEADHSKQKIHELIQELKEVTSAQELIEGRLGIESGARGEQSELSKRGDSGSDRQQDSRRKVASETKHVSKQKKQKKVSASKENSMRISEELGDIDFEQLSAPKKQVVEEPPKRKQASTPSFTAPFAPIVSIKPASLLQSKEFYDKDIDPRLPKSAHLPDERIDRRAADLYAAPSERGLPEGRWKRKPSEQDFRL